MVFCMFDNTAYMSNRKILKATFMVAVTYLPSSHHAGQANIWAYGACPTSPNLNKKPVELDASLEGLHTGKNSSFE